MIIQNFQSKYCIFLVLLVILYTAILLLELPKFGYGNTVNQHMIKHKLLVVVPGFSFQPASLNLILSNMELLHSDSHVAVTCIIFHYVFPSHQFYNSFQSADAMKLRRYCKLSAYSGSDYGFYVKAVNPSLVQLAGFSHVMILLDDVQLVDFHTGTFLNIMTHNNLTLASPTIKQGQFPCNRLENVDGGVGSPAVAIEVFASVFTTSAFACFWTLMDPVTNFIGWGYDLYFQPFCSALGQPQRIGVVSHRGTEAVHRPMVAKGPYNPRAALRGDYLQLAVKQEQDVRSVVLERYHIQLPEAAVLRDLTHEIPRLKYPPLMLPPLPSAAPP